MGWIEFVHWSGVAVALVAAIYLWALRRRRRLTLGTAALPVMFMVLGLTADLFPTLIIIGAAFIYAFLVDAGVLIQLLGELVNFLLQAVFGLFDHHRPNPYDRDEF